MKHKFQFSYKRQKLLTFTLVGSSLLVCLMSQAREFPSIKLPQKEYRLTGTSLQSVKEIVPYYDSCNTVYDFLIPVDDYVITSYVGPRWGRTHNGIDLAVNVGTPVKSSTAGTVIQSGWNGGYGISVYVDCGDGMVIRYGHLSETSVEVGQTVAQGDLLGLSGNTGNSTGPHLHFEMRVNDEVVDPLEYVKLQ